MRLKLSALLGSESAEDKHTKIEHFLLSDQHHYLYDFRHAVKKQRKSSLVKKLKVKGAEVELIIKSSAGYWVKAENKGRIAGE
jgi:hypothetical protein